MITLKKQSYDSEKNLKEHIDHVVQNYHEQLKLGCQTILSQFESVCLKLSCPYLHHAKDLFNYLTQKLNFHLVMEENVIFPMILNESAGDRLSLVSQTMEAEHLEDNSIVNDIIKILNQAEETDKISALLNELRIFQAHLKEHTQYEDEYIFKS